MLSGRFVTPSTAALTSSVAWAMSHPGSIPTGSARFCVAVELDDSTPSTATTGAMSSTMPLSTSSAPAPGHATLTVMVLAPHPEVAEDCPLTYTPPKTINTSSRFAAVRCWTK